MVYLLTCGTFRMETEVEQDLHINNINLNHREYKLGLGGQHHHGNLFHTKK